MGKVIANYKRWLNQVTVTRNGPLNLNLREHASCAKLLFAVHVKQPTNASAQRRQAGRRAQCTGLFTSVRITPRDGVSYEHTTHAQACPFSPMLFPNRVPNSSPALSPPDPILAVSYPCSLPPCLYSALPPLPAFGYHPPRPVPPPPLLSRTIQ